MLCTYSFLLNAGLGYIKGGQPNQKDNLYSMDSAVHFVNTSRLGSDLPT